MVTTISGIATTLSGVGGNVGIIAGIIIAIVPTITYIITEGKLDKEGINLALKSAGDIVNGKLTQNNVSRETF